jgi:hypothetical protein
MENKLEEIKKACEDILSNNKKVAKENTHLTEHNAEVLADMHSENVIAEFILKMIKEK